MTPSLTIRSPKDCPRGLISVPAGKASVHAAGHMHHHAGMQMPISYSGPTAAASLDL